MSIGGRPNFTSHDEPLNILGVDIQNGEITPEVSKVEAFNALSSPQSFQELGKALGSFTWLSAHIPASQELAAPLHQLLHGERWFWTGTHENAFQEMKKLVLSRRVRKPMPLISSPDKVFVYADASLVGCGGMIAAGESLETAKPVLYHSRVFNPAQSNYPTHEQELLAVVDILKTYYHLMAGREFTLLTDSQAMTSIFSQKHLSPRQARWMLFLGQFPMKIEHIPGETNVIADLLSRIPEYSGYVSGSLHEPVDELPRQRIRSNCQLMMMVWNVSPIPQLE
jgi:RNase H-like domain found in reverse transcriptase